jgi:hypothetical protein
MGHMPQVGLATTRHDTTHLNHCGRTAPACGRTRLAERHPAAHRASPPNDHRTAQGACLTRRGLAAAPSHLPRRTFPRRCTRPCCSGSRVRAPPSCTAAQRHAPSSFVVHSMHPAKPRRPACLTLRPPTSLEAVRAPGPCSTTQHQHGPRCRRDGQGDQDGHAAHVQIRRGGEQGGRRRGAGEEAVTRPSEKAGGGSDAAALRGGGDGGCCRRDRAARGALDFASRANPNFDRAAGGARGRSSDRRSGRAGSMWSGRECQFSKRAHVGAEERPGPSETRCRTSRATFTAATADTRAPTSLAPRKFNSCLVLCQAHSPSRGGVGQRRVHLSNLRQCLLAQPGLARCWRLRAQRADSTGTMT